MAHSILEEFKTYEDIQESFNRNEALKKMNQNSQEEKE